jgi:spermidine/putrescine-binding protein
MLTATKKNTTLQGKVYGLPHIWGTDGLVVNTKLAKISSYPDLCKAEYKGKTSMRTKPGQSTAHWSTYLPSSEAIMGSQRTQPDRNQAAISQRTPPDRNQAAIQSVHVLRTATSNHRYNSATNTTNTIGTNKSAFCRLLLYTKTENTRLYTAKERINPTGIFGDSSVLFTKR